MLIKNGRLIDPSQNIDGLMDLRIVDEKISEISDVLMPQEGEEVIDAKGLVVAPGFVDTHVHFRDPGFTYKENIITGSESAAAGGFTTVICMANTNPIMDNLETLNIPLYASFEKKMGCGFGVCSGCSQHTSKGHRLVCKDGPVFLGEEVFDLD